MERNTITLHKISTGYIILVTLSELLKGLGFKGRKQRWALRVHKEKTWVDLLFL